MDLLPRRIGEATQHSHRNSWACHRKAGSLWSPRAAAHIWPRTTSNA